MSSGAVELEAAVVRARGGDQESIRVLLANLENSVKGKLSMQVNLPWRSLLDAEDVWQVTSLEVYTRIKTFERGGARNFAAWVYKLAENNLRDAVRALEAGKRPPPNRRISGNDQYQTKTALINSLAGKGSTPSVYAANDEAITILDRAMQELPPDYEKVVRLYDIQQRTSKEVAAEMGRSEGAVFMLRARAHDRLKEILGSASNFYTSGG